MDKIKIGKLGERYAEKFLTSQNYEILEHNFHSRFGEIDIIAIDHNFNQLVFAEVKTRTNLDFGLPEEAMDFRKRSKILKTIYCFLESTSEGTARAYTTKLRLHTWRIDFIALQLNQQFGLKKINHFKNI